MLWATDFGVVYTSDFAYPFPGYLHYGYLVHLLGHPMKTLQPIRLVLRVQARPFFSIFGTDYIRDNRHRSVSLDNHYLLRIYSSPLDCCALPFLLKWHNLLPSKHCRFNHKKGKKNFAFEEIIEDSTGA